MMNWWDSMLKVPQMVVTQCNPTVRPVHPFCLRSTNAPITLFFSSASYAFWPVSLHSSVRLWKKITKTQSVAHIRTGALGGVKWNIVHTIYILVLTLMFVNNTAGVNIYVKSVSQRCCGIHMTYIIYSRPPLNAAWNLWNQKDIKVFLKKKTRFLKSAILTELLKTVNRTLLA